MHAYICMHGPWLAFTINFYSHVCHKIFFTSKCCVFFIDKVPVLPSLEAVLLSSRLVL